MLCWGNTKEEAEHLDKLLLAVDTNRKKDVRVDDNEVARAKGGQLMRSQHSHQLCRPLISSQRRAQLMGEARGGISKQIHGRGENLPLPPQGAAALLFLLAVK